MGDSGDANADRSGSSFDLQNTRDAGESFRRDTSFQTSRLQETTTTFQYTHELELMMIDVQNPYYY